MATLTVTKTAPSGLKVDAVAVAVAQGDDGPVLLGASDVDKAFKGRLAATLRALNARGKAGEATTLATLGAIRAPVLVAVGVGPQTGPAPDHETLRRAAGVAARTLAGTASVGLALPAPDAQSVAAVAEGALLGAYAFLRYRASSRAAQRTPVEQFTLVTELARDRSTKAAVARAHHLAEAVHLARDWVNTPPGDMTPAVLAEAAAGAAKGRKLSVEVLDDTALRKGGYGGILGVGQGSANPPRLVKISYRPGRAKRHLALIGKGITFDSGGLSLKPAQSMEWMKSDMGGAAAVIAAITAIADLGLPVAVTAWAPLAENMPSGSAQRPSDVLTTFGGKTVEVLNTDAEGRLVLADALGAASAEHPDLLVDAATLTGAQLVALGSRTAGIMSNRDAVRDAVHAAAGRAGEAMWPMPLPDELRPSMDSTIADIANIGDRNGGMLVAGLFLREFVGNGLPWVHLDIAGPAFNQGDPHGYTPKGGTGAAVRTLVRIAEELADGGIV